MSDLPTQGSRQQMHARHVSADHLEVLGKQASSRWASGRSSTLTEAVIETVKHAHLAPEQVKRVVEFANGSAYQSEFKKEGAGHKFVDFGKGGPANPSQVLQELNCGGSGTVFDRGTSDYSSPPEKTASAFIEGSIEKAFEKNASDALSGEAEDVGENPFREVMDIREKLGAAYDLHRGELSSLEVDYADVVDQAYHEVKQAALGGHSLGEVLQAWAEVAPSADYVKVAFQLFTPRLLRERVFFTPDALNESIQKTASEYTVVNREHPLVQSFGTYCQTLSKLAAHRVAVDNLKFHYDDLTDYLQKEARGVPTMAGRAVKPVVDVAKRVGRGMGLGGGGDKQKAMKAVEDFAGARAGGMGVGGPVTQLRPETIGNGAVGGAPPSAAVPPAGAAGPSAKGAPSDGLIPEAWRKLREGGEWLGQKAAPVADKLYAGAGKPVGTALKYAPHVALALGANQARLALENSPAVQEGLSYVPGTDAYNYQNIMRQQGY